MSYSSEKDAVLRPAQLDFFPQPTDTPTASLTSEPRRLARLQRHALTLIWVVLVFAIAADRTKRGGPAEGWTWIIALACGYSLMRPSSRQRMLIVCCAQLFCYIYGFDGLRRHEHIYVASIFSLIILAGAALVDQFGRHWPPSVNLYTIVRPAAALLGFGGVFYAGLAKLNTSFLDLDVSCGAIYYAWIRTNPLFFFLPGGDIGSIIGIYGSIAAELAGALLLIPRATRKLGLLAIWLLTFMLYMNIRSHYYEFIGVFFAASLFLVNPQPLAGITRRITVIRRKFSCRLRRGGLRHIPRLFPLLVGTGFSTSIVSLSAADRGWLEGYRIVCSVIWAVVVGAILWDWRRRRRPLPAARPPSKLSTVMLILPALFLFNEATAYLGLPHSPTLTMASNLSLEPVGGNHIIFSNNAALRVWPDVEIIKSSVPRWSKGVHVPWHRFKHVLSSRPDATVTYRVDDGPIIEILRAGDHDTFTRSPLSRFLKQRDYRPNKRPRGCGKPLPGMSRKATRALIRKRRRERTQPKQEKAPETPPSLGAKK